MSSPPTGVTQSTFDDVVAAAGGDKAAARAMLGQVDEARDAHERGAVDELRAMFPKVPEERVRAELAKVDFVVDQALGAVLEANQEVERAARLAEAAAARAAHADADAQARDALQRQQLEGLVQLFKTLKPEVVQEELDAAEGDVDAATDALLARVEEDETLAAGAAAAAAQADQVDAQKRRMRGLQLDALADKFPLLPYDEVRAAFEAAEFDMTKAAPGLIDRQREAMVDAVYALFATGAAAIGRDDVAHVLAAHRWNQKAAVDALTARTRAAAAATAAAAAAAAAAPEAGSAGGKAEVASSSSSASASASSPPSAAAEAQEQPPKAEEGTTSTTTAAGAPPASDDKQAQGGGDDVDVGDGAAAPAAAAAAAAPARLQTADEIAAADKAARADVMASVADDIKMSQLVVDDESKQRKAAFKDALARMLDDQVRDGPAPGAPTTFPVDISDLTFSPPALAAGSTAAAAAGEAAGMAAAGAAHTNHAAGVEAPTTSTVVNWGAAALAAAKAAAGEGGGSSSSSSSAADGHADAGAPSTDGGATNTAPEVVLTAAPSVVDVGEAITVSWAGAGDATSSWDWVGMFRAGSEASNRKYVQYQWRGRAGSAPSDASVEFTAPKAFGRYVFKFFRGESSYREVASSAVVCVGPEVSLHAKVTDGATATDPKTANVRWTHNSGKTTSRAWIGLYETAEANHKKYIHYEWAPAASRDDDDDAADDAAAAADKDGKTFTLPVKPGDYEFRFFPGSTNSYDCVARSAPIQIRGDDKIAVPTVSPPKEIVVSLSVVSADPAKESVWVGLYLQDEANPRSFRRYKSVKQRDAEVVFNSVPRHEGKYVAKLVTTGYRILATSEPFDLPDAM